MFSVTIAYKKTNINKPYRASSEPQASVIKLVDDENSNIIQSIDIRKDVDGVTCLGFGKMTMEEEAFGSCTPAGIMRILEHYEIDISGKTAVVVGRSPILGKPMAMMLLNKNATVTICHSRTKN